MSRLLRRSSSWSSWWAKSSTLAEMLELWFILWHGLSTAKNFFSLASVCWIYSLNILILQVSLAPDKGQRTRLRMQKQRSEGYWSCEWQAGQMRIRLGTDFLIFFFQIFYNISDICGAKFAYLLFKPIFYFLRMWSDFLAHVYELFPSFLCQLFQTRQVWCNSTF